MRRAWVLAALSSSKPRLFAMWLNGVYASEASCKTPLLRKHDSCRCVCMQCYAMRSILFYAYSLWVSCIVCTYCKYVYGMYGTNAMWSMFMVCIYIYGMYMVSKKFPGMWWYVMACNGMMCNVMEGNVMHVCVLCNGCNGYCGHWWNARNGCTGYNACTECTECNVCNVHCNV